ncbi:MAG: hypothetical protein K5681_09140 [Treponema sp.]|nr:hypothetical protein [Treponema sp.]
MKRKILFVFTILLPLTILITGCFNEKSSPFYDSEWVMQNLDNNADLYYHHLILSPGHKVTLRVSYADSTNIIVWTGSYKINSKKIIFDFTECQRYENGQKVGNYTSAQLLKYYTGDFYYSTAPLADENGKERYHLQLIRPQNYFYGDGSDIFGNQFEDFIKVEKGELTDD